MANSVIEFSYTNEGMENILEDAINDHQLIFNAGSLKAAGFNSVAEIQEAIERAMKVCNFNGLAVQRHFKTIFVSDNNAHTLRKDWKLSRLAYTLVMMNGSSDNPIVARLQLQLLKKFMS